MTMDMWGILQTAAGQLPGGDSSLASKREPPNCVLGITHIDKHCNIAMDQQAKVIQAKATRDVKLARSGPTTHQHGKAWASSTKRYKPASSESHSSCA